MSQCLPTRSACTASVSASIIGRILLFPPPRCCSARSPRVRGAFISPRRLPCSDDPIRVFQRFSTVNALSSGRAEVILGRGSFTESFPLFGYDLSNYETLFDDKLDLFASLLKREPVTWRGKRALL